MPRLARILLWLAISLLGRRLESFRTKPDAPFTESRVQQGEWYRAYRQHTISLQCSSAGWREALAFAEQELRRACLQGFSAQEMTAASASLLSRLSQLANAAGGRSPRELAEEYAHALVQGELLCAPARRLELAKSLLGRLSPDDLKAELVRLFPEEGRRLFVCGDTLPGPEPQVALLEAYAASARQPVGALAETAASSWAYASFGTPGRVQHRNSLTQPSLEQVEFENGVRLNIMRTKGGGDKVELLAYVGEGAAGAPLDKPGLSWLAQRSLMQGGLGKHASAECSTLFAGKAVNLRFSVGFSAFEFRGSTTTRDLRLELEYLAAQLSDPGWRAEGTRLARAGIAPQYAALAHGPGGPLQRELARFVAGGDVRFGLPARADLEARTDAELRAWLSEELSAGPLELGLLGNVDLEQAIQHVSETLGALPVRRAARLPRSSFSVQFPEVPFERHYTVSSSLPKALVLVYWPTTDGINLRRGLLLRILAEAVKNRLRIRIRQEMGGTYTPSVRNNASQAIPGYGYIVATIDVAPDMVARVNEAVLEVGEDLARGGISETEFEELRRPALTALKDSLRSPNYLLSSLVARAQKEPARVAWHRDCVGILTKLRAEELSALAAQYLPRSRASRASIVPDGKGPSEAPVPVEGERPEEAPAL